jgi:hypothetical protein
MSDIKSDAAKVAIVAIRTLGTCFLFHSIFGAAKEKKKRAT